MENTLINIGLYVTYALAILAVVAAVVFSIYQFFGNIKQSKTTLYGLVGLVVVFLAAYFLSSGTDVSAALFDKVGANYDSSKMIGAGMNMLYIIFGLTVVALLGTEIARPFKK